MGKGETLGNSSVSAETGRRVTASARRREDPSVISHGKFLDYRALRLEEGEKPPWNRTGMKLPLNLIVCSAKGSRVEACKKPEASPATLELIIISDQGRAGGGLGFVSLFFFCHRPTPFD